MKMMIKFDDDLPHGVIGEVADWAHKDNNNKVVVQLKLDGDNYQAYKYITVNGTIVVDVRRK